MKYIIIRGAKNEGKSTTIDAVCRLLNPDRVDRLNITQKILEPFDMSEPLHNGCFVLTVGGKIILVSAGATTEHGITITLLVEIIIRLKLRVDFAIVAMRSHERREGFNTPEELLSLGDDMGTVYINHLGDDYQNSEEWKRRVQGIVDTLKKHGLDIPEIEMV